MALTSVDIKEKYGDNVDVIYKEHMYEPYVEEDLVDDFQAVMGNKVVALMKSNIPRKEIAKHLKISMPTVDRFYKENMGEFVEVKKVSHGVVGAVTYNKEEGKVLCAECGGWYKSLEKHIKLHDLSVDEYKKKHGLLKKTPLISLDLSEKRSKASKNREGLKIGHVMAREGKIQSHKNETRNSVGFKNTKNLCDEQIKKRFDVVATMSGGYLTTSGLQKYDMPLYKYLTHKYGSVDKFCTKFPQISRTSNAGKYRANITSREKVIAELRQYVIQYGKEPNHKDLKRKNGLPSLQTIYNHFGSWRRAKMMAGLDQLLQEVKGN